MSTRIARLWQPGNPQTRVFLPDFWMRFVETPNVGRNRLPPHAAKFEVHPQMSRMDVRQYLEKIYKLPVRDNRMGEIEWSNRHSKRYRQALWKEDDQKFAYVFFVSSPGFFPFFPFVLQKLGSDAQIRFFDLSQDEYSEMDKQMSATARYIKDQTDAVDRVNEKRPGVGQLLP
ncbi:hypothetical protein M3Y99_01374700 [Aphelenchoides fujianensis]|nr:hypothetical protein M3Y99_01374700 [Aphelenchoides fujianensis]